MTIILIRNDHSRCAAKVDTHMSSSSAESTLEHNTSSFSFQEAMNCKESEIIIPFERFLDKLLNQLLSSYYGEWLEETIPSQSFRYTK